MRRSELFVLDVPATRLCTGLGLVVGCLVALAVPASALFVTALVSIPAGVALGYFVGLCVELRHWARVETSKSRHPSSFRPKPPPFRLVPRRPFDWETCLPITDTARSGPVQSIH